MAREHRVRHSRQRIDVDALVQWGYTHSLLGRHIRGCAGGHGRANRVDHRLGDTEVCDEHLGAAVRCLAEQQVSRGDVAVDDVIGVQHVERAASFGTKPKCAYRLDPLLAKIVKDPPSM